MVAFTIIFFQSTKLDKTNSLFSILAGVIDPMQFSNRAQGFRNDKSQEISSTTAKSYQPVTQGVVGDKSSSINNIRDPEKKVDIVEEFPSWAGKPKVS